MDKFYEKTLKCERKYTGKIINVDLIDSKTLSAWALYKLMR